MTREPRARTSWADDALQPKGTRALRIVAEGAALRHGYAGSLAASKDDAAAQKILKALREKMLSPLQELRANLTETEAKLRSQTKSEQDLAKELAQIADDALQSAVDGRFTAKSSMHHTDVESDYNAKQKAFISMVDTLANRRVDMAQHGLNYMNYFMGDLEQALSESANETSKPGDTLKTIYGKIQALGALPNLRYTNYAQSDAFAGRGTSEMKFYDAHKPNLAAWQKTFKLSGAAKARFDEKLAQLEQSINAPLDQAMHRIMSGVAYDAWQKDAMQLIQRANAPRVPSR